MVEYSYDYSTKFKKKFKKADRTIKDQVNSRVEKVLDDPYVGKPMRYNRKGTREVYVGHFRLSYFFDEVNAKVIFLDFYHKDYQ